MSIKFLEMVSLCTLLSSRHLQFYVTLAAFQLSPSWSILSLASSRSSSSCVVWSFAVTSSVSTSFSEPCGHPHNKRLSVLLWPGQLLLSSITCHLAYSACPSALSLSASTSGFDCSSAYFSFWVSLSTYSFALAASLHEAFILERFKSWQDLQLWHHGRLAHQLIAEFNWLIVCPAHLYMRYTTWHQNILEHYITPVLVTNYTGH